MKSYEEKKKQLFEKINSLAKEDIVLAFGQQSAVKDLL